MTYSKQEMVRWRNLEYRYTTRDNGSIYLMRADNGLYKIGQTKDVANRLKGLNAMSPIPIELIFSVQFRETGELEGLLHKRFASKVHHGEWFVLNDKDIEFICSLTTENITEIFGGPLR